MAMLAPYCCQVPWPPIWACAQNGHMMRKLGRHPWFTYPKPVIHVHDLDVASPLNQNSCHKKHIVEKCLRERLELIAEPTRLLLLCLWCSKHVIPTCRGNFTVYHRQYCALESQMSHKTFPSATIFASWRGWNHKIMSENTIVVLFL
jgi:hypothetical protein